MPINRAEILRELDATDEAFVRQKFASKGYGQARQKLVGEWLQHQDAKRMSDWALVELAASRRTARWTMVSAVAACVAAVIAIVALLAK